MKKNNQLEYIVRGFSNKRRIEILFLIEKRAEMSVSEISKATRISVKNTSAHLLKLMSTGLVMKRNVGNSVRNSLTEKGKKVCQFLREV